jgi:iron complex transport system ATP-binding protein
MTAHRQGLTARGLTLGYGDRTVSRGLDLAIPAGAFTAVIGPNACGKSTLLRALVRLQPLLAGSVELDGRDLSRLRVKEVARAIAFLPQRNVAPEGISVAHLVRRGRYPYRSWRSTWTDADEAAVQQALADTGTTDLAHRRVEELSGGQAQRVWLALVLAQETEVLLLDEPTTFLDVAHQYELLALLARLRDRGRTVVAVLHEINQACRYADHVIAMCEGRVVAEGQPGEVMTPDLVADVFGLAARVVPDPVVGTPMVVPLPL